MESQIIILFNISNNFIYFYIYCHLLYLLIGSKLLILCQ